jgi:hypothetical protein
MSVLPLSHGPLRLPSPVAQETPLGPDQPQAGCPAPTGTQGTAGLGLDHEPTQGRLQPHLQPDNAGVLGGRRVLGCGALSRYGLRFVKFTVVLQTERAP